MKSFIDLDATLSGQPPRLGARLARIDTGRGREQLLRDQLPELLRGLAEETRVASITASNAIENITVESARAHRLITPGHGPLRLRDRNEREFAGYRDAIDELMRQEPPEPLSVPLILHLHRRLLRHVDGGGGRLKTDQNLIVDYEGGQRRVLFTPVAPHETEFALSELVVRYRNAAAREAGHPVLLIGLAVLDFLAIHPVADGNGRLARLLTSHLLRQQQYEIARYVSLEQRILETKHAYYDALQAAQRGWHEAAHDPWPWLSYLTSVIADAYELFERRLAARDPMGLSKQERVRRYVLEQAPPVFRFRDVRRAVPGVSDQTIRLVLAALKGEGLVSSSGTGPGSFWTKPGGGGRPIGSG